MEKQRKNIGVDVGIESIWDSVLQRHLNPENSFEIAAILESLGWTDGRIKQNFGYENVFELADVLWELGQHRVQFQTNEYQEEEPVYHKYVDYFRQFLRGMIFALPMVLSIASMLFFRFSLWSYQNLSVELATAIALGTILSFVTVGGFMQAIARRGFFYIFQGYFRMAGRITFRFIAVGVVMSICTSIALLVLNTLFPVLPFSMLGVTVVYYMVLNSIWLAVTAMYMLQRELVFTGLLLVGILLVYVGFKGLDLNILVAQVASMIIIAILGIILVIYFFRRAEGRLERGINTVLPKTSVTVFSVLPYFNYGFLYFLMLFVDRILAWSTNGQFMPLNIWFRGDYEVGLDFALIMMVVPMGVSEVVVSRIMNEVAVSQRKYLGKQTRDMGAVYLRKYRNGLITMICVSIPSAVAVYLVVRLYVNPDILAVRGEMLVTASTNYVFVVGLISYTILGVALLNAVTLFSLSRPEGVLRPLLLAVTIDVVLGFLATRWIHYTDAVWGLFAGSILFMILTSRNVSQVIRDVDYHLYLLS